jgi:hypothetical protein
LVAWLACIFEAELVLGLRFGHRDRRRPELISIPQLLVPYHGGDDSSRFGEPAEHEGGRDFTDWRGRSAEMGFVAWWYAWTHALLYMSPYVYSAIGIAISIGVSVLGASW